MTTAAIDWRTCLSDVRIGSAASLSKREEQSRSEFHKDYDRIIFSSAFRRLSDKTQVVPFPQSDYTRRRLTHSLEVSCVGRSLATEIYNCAELGLGKVLSQGDFEAIVATACLAHDIGNPPFGHFGEKAIQDWARSFLNQDHPAGSTGDTDRFGLQQLTVAERMDLTEFEGNAQSFRVLTRLQMANRPGGMRLTAATLGALIKYPRPSVVSEPSRYRKHGCFQDDLPLFQQVFQVTGQPMDVAGEGGAREEFSRHPRAWLSEAADDICYVIVDLEDGWKAGLITLDEATEILDGIGKSQRRESSIPPEDRLAMGRALAINQLVQQCATVYRDNVQRIVMGEFQGALIEHCPSIDYYLQARTLVRDRVFHSIRVLELEAAGYRAIQGLLGMLVPAVLTPAPDRLQQHLRRLAGVNLSETMSVYQKILACTDNVSGMTDRYCVEQYQKWSGV